jgi:hypothetical protein
MDIDGEMAPVIHAIVNTYFVKMASWEVMFCIIQTMLFLY